MAFARESFKLDLPGGDGVSLREKLDHLGKDSGAAEPPPGTLHLWEWFAELQSSRSGNGFGANPMPYAEISAWAALTGRVVRPWEVRALKALDLAYIAEVSSRG